MKAIFTAVALSILAATAAQAAGANAPSALQQREVSLTNGKDIAENRGQTVTVTVGAPKELSTTALPPRDRVEAGYKAQTTINAYSFSSSQAADDVAAHKRR